MSILKTLLGDSYVEGMSEDEISQALEKTGIANQGEEIAKLRNAISNSNKENADWKRKYRELESAGQTKEDDTQKTIVELQNAYAELQKDKKIADNKAELLSLGYSDELAKSTAVALVEGDTAKVFENQKAFQEIYSKKLKADLMKTTPTPAKGGVPEVEDFQKMTVTEKMKLKVNDPELYEKLSNGGT